MVGARMIKIIHICPKTQQAAEEGGGRMSQTRHDRQFKWRGEKRRRWKRKRKTAGLGWWKGSGHREGKEQECERQRKKQGLELFNYTTHRQQRPRFQQTITVCSPEGKSSFSLFQFSYSLSTQIPCWNI